MWITDTLGKKKKNRKKQKQKQTQTDAGKDWRQEEKGMTKDEMVGWHHWLNGHEFEQAQGVGDGQGGLACCYSWSRKKSDTTEQLSWTELKGFFESVWQSQMSLLSTIMIFLGLLARQFPFLWMVLTINFSFSSFLLFISLSLSLLSRDSSFPWRV